MGFHVLLVSFFWTSKGGGGGGGGVFGAGYCGDGVIAASVSGGFSFAASWCEKTMTCAGSVLSAVSGSTDNFEGALLTRPKASILRLLPILL